VDDEDAGSSGTRSVWAQGRVTQAVGRETYIPHR